MRIEAEGIRLAFGGVEVLKGVDLTLNPGEVHALVGENGAGKSSLAKVIAGVYRPSGGVLRADGEPLPLSGPREALERGIALIHQEPLTFPDLTVAENVFVGYQPTSGRLGRVNWRQMNERAGELLRELGTDLDPRQLAGGLAVADQQMLELASALAHASRVLIFDETTASLTPREVERLFGIVRRLKAQGVAIAIVSHRLDEVMAISDRITVLRDGAKVAELAPSTTSVPEIIQAMVGREVSLDRSETALSLGEPILTVTGLSRGGEFSDVSFAVRPGEIVGLAGLVGAGRTEVCEALFGLRPADSGEVRFLGRSLNLKGPAAAIRQGMAMVPEDRQHDGLLLPMSLSENATLSVLRRLFPAGWRSGRREASTTERGLRELGTAFRSVAQPVRQLSGGNQQKVVLAKWLATEPKLLILDEPTRGVDVGAKEQVHRLIRRLADEGMAILMASSDLSEVLQLSDRILVMREGRMVTEIAGSAATSEDVMAAATGGVAVA